MASKHPQGKRNAVCGHLWPKAERGCSVQGNHLLGGGQHRVCLVCGNAAARLPHEFRAEARTHFMVLTQDEQSSTEQQWTEDQQAEQTQQQTM